jgi:putative drug exporter of the RND superfamily
MAVAAAMGVTTLVFQSIAGNSGLTFYVPFAAAVLLVALGADYSIFGVGYIWAEARHRPLVGAIRVAVPRSTRAISAAGITLALSFAMLAFVPLRPFREFAVAMSVGILVDVYVVRTLLVPSLVSLARRAGGQGGPCGGAPRPHRSPSPRALRRRLANWLP